MIQRRPKVSLILNHFFVVTKWKTLFNFNEKFFARQKNDTETAWIFSNRE